MRLPGFMLGSVRVRVPKVGILIGLLGVPITYAGTITGNPILSGAGIGMLCVMPIHSFFQWLAERQVDRKMKNFPVSVQVMQGPDGERVAFVTAHGGTVSTLVIPDDYNPDDDNGEWLIRQVAPELADMLDMGKEEED